jgi:hypothetical protein
MEIKLTSVEAVSMFNIWHTEKESGARRVEGGAIQLDSVPSIPGAEHAMDGSTVIVWYQAAEEPTARAIQEARTAVEIMQLPRKLYMGKLIDIKKGRDGTVYFLVRSMTRHDANGQPAYRAFNPSKGQLLEMTINPSGATINTAFPVVSAPAIQPTQVDAGVVIRRTGR